MRRDPLNFTPVGINSIPPAHLHVRPMGALSTCRCAGEIKKQIHPEYFTALFREQGARAPTPGSMPSRSVICTRPEPFNSTPMRVNPISSGSPHVHPMGRTCGEPDEIKKDTHPKDVTTLFGDQVLFRRGRVARVAGRDVIVPDHPSLAGT